MNEISKALGTQWHMADKCKKTKLLAHISLSYPMEMNSYVPLRMIGVKRHEGMGKRWTLRIVDMCSECSLQPAIPTNIPGAGSL